MGKTKLLKESPGLAQELALNAPIFQLLEEFSMLKDNWDGEEALAPSKKAIEKAKKVANLLSKKGQIIYHTAPGPNGEIMLDVRNKTKNKSFELIFYPNRSVYITFFKNEKPKQGLFDTTQLSFLLDSINQ